MATERQKAKFGRAIKKAKKLYKTGRYKKFSDAVKAAYKVSGITRQRSKPRKRKRKPATKSGGALQSSTNKKHTMARSRRSRRRRRSIGAKLNANSPLLKYAPPVVGYLVGNSINGQVDKLFENVTDAEKKALYQKIAHAGMLALWAWYAFGRKGQKNPMPLIALGIIGGAGLKGLLADLNVGIAGFQQVPVIGGYQQVPVVGAYGSTMPQAMNGIGSFSLPSGNLGAYDAQGSSVVNGIYKDNEAGLMRQD